jgi:aspartyl protease family protein
MATGFMSEEKMFGEKRNCRGILVALLIVGVPAWAVGVDVVGLTDGKAVISVNGGGPRTLKAGETSKEGVKLVSATSGEAVIEVEGKRETLKLGQSISASFAPSGKASVTLVADTRGHFVTTGSVNGGTVKFLVDTGASMVSMGATEAKRLGINYLRGEGGLASTANGIAHVYRVKLDSVKVGDIAISNVDGLVHEGAGPDIVLLGMSFLNRVEMRRDGTSMTLTGRF